MAKLQDLHATDLKSGSSVVHTPSPVGQRGKGPVSDGYKWTMVEVATKADLTGIGTGSGDMDKATYDPDDDGTVETADYAATAGDADTLDGKEASDFADATHTHTGMGIPILDDDPVTPVDEQMWNLRTPITDGGVTVGYSYLLSQYDATAGIVVRAPMN